MSASGKNDYFDKLEKSKAEVLAFSREASVEQLNFRPDGKWSVLQHIHHVILAENAIVAYMRKKKPHLTNQDKTGISAKLKLQSVKVALNVGYKAKAPSITADLPETSVLEAEEKFWEAGRADLKSLLDEMPESTMELGIFKHPVAGRLNGYQALDFMLFHLEHHRKAMVKCLN